MDKHTIAIHVVITGVSFPIPVGVPLVIIQDSPAVVTGIPKDILITVPLVYIVSQDTVVLDGKKVFRHLHRLISASLLGLPRAVCFIF